MGKRTFITSRHYYHVWIFLLCMAASIAGAHAEDTKSTAMVRTRLSKEITIRELQRLNVDILAVYPDGRVDLGVTASQLEWVTLRAPMAEVIERSMLLAPSALNENLGLYHTYVEMEIVLDSLHAEYPGLTRIDTLGTSIEGRLIRAIKISDNAAIDESEPEVFLMGCHHAREIMSVEIPLMMVTYLLDNYGTSQQVTGLVDEREIWIAPMINPDGHVYVQNNHGGDWWTWWRKNRRDNGDGTFGVDLNRNYGYQWGYDDVGSDPDPGGWTYRGTAPFSEPEAQAVRDFCDSREFVTALSYHTYSELIIYPWGYDAIYTDDHELFATLADSLNVGLGYAPGCTATNVLYPANGGTDDWAYGDTTLKPPIYCYTIELNTADEGGFGPPDTMIQPTFDKVLQLNLTIIRRAGDPAGVLPPEVPSLYEVVDLADPSHLVSWTAGSPSDPNPPISYSLQEYSGLSWVTDPCEVGDTLWVENGFSISSARAYGGSGSYYSGQDNYLHNYIEMAAFYPVSQAATILCQLWYDIEDGWDYAFVEASFDDGLTWQTVPGDLTTDYDPNGNNLGNGITGSSAGWVPAEFYLDQIPGILTDSILKIRFVYSTDASVMGEGIYIDDIGPVTVYEDLVVLAESLSDTFYVREADETGFFAYQVNATDIDGHQSRGSNIVFHTVSDITDTEMTPPLRTTLLPNYPNPFNPSTMIRFIVGGRVGDTASPLTVTLELFDIGGRRVRSFADRLLVPGEYSVVWNGRSSSGEAVSSGIYFLRLEVGGESFNRKLVLLR